MLKGHLNNPFDSARISNANLSTFAEKHAALLTSFNGPAELLSALTPLINNFKLRLSEISTSEGRKQAKTVSVDDLIDGIKKFISRKGGVVADKFPADSPAYQEFFPYGRGEYTKARKKNIQVLVERFRDACIKYKTELGDEIGQQMSTYALQLADMRKVQIENISGVKDKSSTLDTARTQLTTQLFVNLLTLILANINDTGKVNNYFDTSMLNRITRQNSKDAIVTPPPPQA